MGTIPSTAKLGKRSAYNQERYNFLLETPFPVSAKCCNVLKKAPTKAYGKKTGRYPITAQMASESRLRTQQWVKNGCNGFDMKRPISNPMAFWTEQDVLLYIKLYGSEMVERRKMSWNRNKDYMVYGSRIVSRATGKTLFETDKWKPLCSVYGEVVRDYEAEGQLQGQMDFSDFGIFGNDRPLLRTTGCQRTGCMFCLYSAHNEKPGEGRLERMKITHPAQYDYIMRPWEQGGLNYKEVIDWTNEHGNLHIRY